MRESSAHPFTMTIDMGRPEILGPGEGGVGI